VCDTLCVVGAGVTRFAKNSDRPIGEAQVVEVHPPRPGGGEVRTQYLTIPDAGAARVVGSRPTWLWGFEHGVNEHGVAIGNERLWTVDDPRIAPPGLIGMDLVRLALERAASAEAAIDTITGLLAAHGQGGSCAADHDDPYWSSFLVADPAGAWILETTGQAWVASPVDDGAAISNCITLGADWVRSSADVAPGTDFTSRNDPFSPLISDPRLAVTRAAVATGAAALDERSLAAVMRAHEAGPWGAPGTDPARVSPPPREVGADLSGMTVCQHVEGISVTAASMVASLGEGPPRLWIALGAPCASIFVPAVFPEVPSVLASEETWRRFDDLRRRAEAQAAELVAIRTVLAPLEHELWSEAEALDPHDGATARRFAAAASARVAAALDRLDDLTR
jgi:secernin